MQKSDVKDGKLYTSADVAQILWERDLAIEQLASLGVGLGERADHVKEALRKAKALRVKAWKGKGGVFFAKCPCSPSVYVPIDKTCYCTKCGQKLLGIDDREKQLDLFSD